MSGFIRGSFLASGASTTAATATQPTIPAARYSVIGTTLGGNTVAAGTASLAWGGEIQLQPAAGLAWVLITGVDISAGDQVHVQFTGLRSATPNAPAQRRVSGAGPGASGTNPIGANEVEITIHASNPTDMVKWWVVRRGT